MLLLLSTLGLHAEPLPLAVHSVTMSREGFFVQDTSSDVVQRVEGELLRAKVKVAFRPSSFYETSPPPTVLYLGIRLPRVDCWAVDTALVECSSDMDFELYHEPTDTVVYRAHAKEVATAMDFEEGAVRTVLEAVVQLAARPLFKACLDSDYYPYVPGPEKVLACEEPTEVAGLRGPSSAVQVLGLDARGKVLVVGSDAETLAVAVQSGPTLSAALVHAGEGMGVYQLPVVGGASCVSDDHALARPVGEVGTVGQALQAMGLERVVPEAPPVTKFESLDKKSDFWSDD